MITLLNFENYDLDYVVEYPVSIEQFEITAETPLNFAGWFFQNDFESFYNVLSTVFNSVYDISLAIEKTFNPNHYAIDPSVLIAIKGEENNRYSEVSKCLSEGFDFLKSNCESDKTYDQLENEIHDSLFFLRSVLNGLSPVVTSLQKRDAKTALLLLRSLFSLDLRPYFLKENKPKFSKLVDRHCNKESYLLPLFSALLEQGAYEHIFRANGFGFNWNENKHKIEFDFRPDWEIDKGEEEKDERWVITMSPVEGFGSWIFHLMATYHHHAFPSQLIPGMRLRGNSKYNVLNSLLSIASLELLFMAVEKIESSFIVERADDNAVPLSRVLTHIMLEGINSSGKRLSDASVDRNICNLRYNLWTFLLFRDKIKVHYISLIERFVLRLKERGSYDSVLHLQVLS